MAVHSARRRLQGILVFAICGILLTCVLLDRTDIRPVHGKWYWKGNGYTPSSFDWSARTPAHAVDPADMVPLPDGPPQALPRIQHRFSPDDLDAAFNKTQRERRNAVRDVAKKSWDAYRTYAWGRDEVRPLSLRGDDTFAGWGATLVDSLDTLWIMGFHAEFHDAVRIVARIDWNNATSSSCSLFETTIRYLGGLLSAHDLSGSPILLAKALELGEMLLAAFDTPTHLPANNLDFSLAKAGALVASPREASAALGTLSLEFTRLSQLTGRPDFHSAIDPIKHHLLRTQPTTKLPGMWPVHLTLSPSFHALDSTFSLGALSDSLYEYLPKTHALLSGTDPAYGTLYLSAAATIQSHLLFAPMLPDPQPDILLPGTVLANGHAVIDLLPELQHLACFAGGMFALGGRLFSNASHVDVGARLARGCAWAYDQFPAGLMPELSEVSKGEEEGLPRPWVSVRDAGWRLRPEAVESLFVMWRVTGEREWVERAWRMWEGVVKAAGAGEGFAMVEDSFWIAETLKYFYLIFSEPELISLDDYVLNTEAHPFRLPKPGDEGITKQTGRAWE
ncbi:glycoside hydrolase [Schizothecium vesticola]|uniref:alpha-1,2-Mannosidase n=1 Tax=Schizothecium vesticola TaxID=314040 RepID=A0AA40F9W0_9PEZI|nr:glycoside hydrolase [Schizothecium vesticola]